MQSTSVESALEAVRFNRRPYTISSRVNPGDAHFSLFQPVSSGMSFRIVPARRCLEITRRTALASSVEADLTGSISPSARMAARSAHCGSSAHVSFEAVCRVGVQAHRVRNAGIRRCLFRAQSARTVPRSSGRAEVPEWGQQDVTDAGQRVAEEIRCWKKTCRVSHRRRGPRLLCRDDRTLAFWSRAPPRPDTSRPSTKRSNFTCAGKAHPLTSSRNRTPRLPTSRCPDFELRAP